MQPPVFDAAFRQHFRRLLEWRRDVREFRTEPVSEELIQELLDLIHLCPSVGLSEPWRLLRVSSVEKRKLIQQEFARANHEALAEYRGEQQARYAALKLAGLETAPVQLAVFADVSTRQGFGLGRRTMPEMVEYSVVAAVNTLWLAARAHGIGLGWVSILDPERVHQALQAPEGWRFVAYLCLGYPAVESALPEFDLNGWQQRSRQQVIAPEI